MTTAGISMVRDEADVVEGTIRHMLDEVDWIIVADNLSTDGTRKILDGLAEEYGHRLTVVDDNEVGYHQADKMSGLAQRAGRLGVSWIVPFDADEIWVSHSGRIREVLAGLPKTENVAPAVLYNHFASALDPDTGCPFTSMGWRQRQPGALPKVAFRWEPGAYVHQGNHGVTLPLGTRQASAELEVRHFPYRSPEQMVSKARNGAQAYAATDLPVEIGAHWREYGSLIERFGEECLHDVFRTYFWHLSPIDAGMIFDPAPFLRWR